VVEIMIFCRVWVRPTVDYYVQGPWPPNSAGLGAVLCDDCPYPMIHKLALAARFVYYRRSPVLNDRDGIISLILYCGTSKSCCLKSSKPKITPCPPTLIRPVPFGPASSSDIILSRPEILHAVSDSDKRLHMEALFEYRSH
jgi:hypothetical protein